MKGFALTFCLFVSLGAWADLKVPFLSGRVVDEAGILDAGAKSQIEELLQRIESRAQGAVLIPQSLQGYDIESYSIAVAEGWKLGKKGSDRGFIVIIAPNERRMRIETGYGIEGELPDAIAKRIISETMAPYFQAGRFGDGIRAGLIAISERLSVDPGQAAPELKRREGTPRLGLFLVICLMLLFFVLRYQNPLGIRRSRWGGGGWGGGGGFGGGGWGGGGGFGGGGFGGGGGGFGGGGASGSW